MQQINIAGFKVNSLTKPELLSLIKNRIVANESTWVTTVYSEFLYAALRNPGVMEMLNKADIAVPDGIGIFWAKKYLTLPLTFKSYFGKILQGFWHIIISLIRVLFNKKDTQTIPGRELIWDIAKLAAENNLSIYILGGYDDTPKLVAQKLQETEINGRKKLFPSLKLKIAGFSSKDAHDQSIIDDIKKSAADILLVAYGPIKQEQWILQNLHKLPSVKLAIGLGGTFDYIAGKRINPPSFIRKIGLEWLFRLITQPHRIKRIWNATFGLINLLWHYKVFSSLPLRPNVAAIILSKENKVLICQRDPRNHHVDIIHTPKTLGSQNYWQFPQGGIDENEDLVKAAEREAKEETGLKNLKFVKISSHINTYMWNNALRKFWKNRRHQNKGQKQSIVYFKNQDVETSVKIDHDEFINYQWIDANELLLTIHPERQTLAKIVFNDLKEMQEKGII